MEIWFCEKCGIRIPEAEQDKSNGQRFCLKCKPAGSSAKHKISTTHIVVKESTGRASSRSLKPASQTRLAPAAGTAPAAPNPIWLNRKIVFAVCAGMIFVIVVGSLIQSNPRQSTPAAMVDSKPFQSSVKKDSIPIPAEHGDRSDHTKARQPDPPATILAPYPNVSNDDLSERTAQDAFDAVSKNTSEVKAVRISKLEGFLAQHENTIVASRARLLLSELKGGDSAHAVPPKPQPKEVVENKPVPPDKPVVVEKRQDSVDLFAAHAAFAAFEDRYFNALRVGEVDDANQELARAEREDALKAFSRELSDHHKSSVWLKEFNVDVPKGLERLKSVDQFELRQTKGIAFKVGKRAEFMVEDIKEGNIYLNSKGITLPVPVSSLALETRLRLAELECKRDSPGLLLRAFMQLLVKDGPVKLPPAAVRKLLDEANSEGAARDDIDYLERMIPAMETSARELMAARAWKEVLKISAHNDFDELKAVIVSFRKHFGDTKYCTSNQAEIQKVVSNVEGMVMDGLAGYWKFDEENGTSAADSSGHGNNGTLIDGPEISNDVPDIGITNRRSLNFDGKKAHVHAARPLSAIDNWSIAAWINPAIVPQTEAIVVYVGNDGAGYGISVNGDSIFVMYGAVAWINSGQTLTPNAWAHVAIMRSGGHLRIYVNGKLTSGTSDAAPNSPENYFEIGHQPGMPVRYYQGKIDDVRVYNRALTPEEIQLLANVKQKSR